MQAVGTQAQTIFTVDLLFYMLVQAVGTHWQNIFTMALLLRVPVQAAGTKGRADHIYDGSTFTCARSGCRYRLGTQGQAIFATDPLLNVG